MSEYISQDESLIPLKHKLKTVNIFGESIDIPLISLGVINLIMNICVSCIVPFFPPFATGNQTYYPGNPCTYIILFFSKSFIWMDWNYNCY